MHAYDVMGNVTWSVRVTEYADYDQNLPAERYAWEGTFSGVGEDLPVRWLRSLLEEVRESI